MSTQSCYASVELCEMQATDPFSTDFKYSRFHATHASPRNVLALSGVRRALKVDKVAGGAEGATMQGDDTLLADLAVSGVSTE